MKKLIVFVLIGLLAVPAAKAQLYYAAIGGRAGKFNTGITFKYFANTNNAIGYQFDGYYTNIASGGYTAKGFVIKQIPFKLPIVQLPLDFIVGGGAHAGYFPYDPQGYYKRRNGEPEYYSKDVVSAGLDGTIQIEYQVRKVVPLTIGIDATPFFEFLNPGPEWIDFGVSIRYVFRY
jgi:hypothetical protein